MEQNTEITPTESTTNEVNPVIDQEKLTQYMEKLRLEQNFPMAVGLGLLAAIVGAVAWAAISVATGYQIGYMAVAIGFLVAYTVRHFGKGLDPLFGYAGAVLALLSCLLGNFFSVFSFAAQAEEVGYVEVYSMIDYALVPDVMIETSSLIDLLFYAIAAYEGYKYSFRPVTEDEIVTNATK